MLITANEFALLLYELRLRYNDSGYPMNNPDFVRGLFQEEHPEVTGVVPPPAYEQILEEYIPREWRIGQEPQERRFPNSPRLEAGSPSDCLDQTPPNNDIGERILRDLDMLRSSPIGALTYIHLRSRNVESEEAMNYAHLAGHVGRLLLISRVAMRASHRSVSPSGTIDAAHEQRAEALARASLVMNATPVGPGSRSLAGTVVQRRSSRPRRQPLTSRKLLFISLAAAESQVQRRSSRPRRQRQRPSMIPPREIRENLREMVRRHGRRGDR